MEVNPYVSTMERWVLTRSITTAGYIAWGRGHDVRKKGMAIEYTHAYG